MSTCVNLFCPNFDKKTFKPLYLRPWTVYVCLSEICECLCARCTLSGLAEHVFNLILIIYRIRLQGVGPSCIYYDLYLTKLFDLYQNTVQ